MNRSARTLVVGTRTAAANLAGLSPGGLDAPDVEADGALAVDVAPGLP